MFKLKVFISHSNHHPDALLIAEAIARKLKRKEIDYWRAIEHLVAGQNWMDEIDKHIHGCNVVILVWSHDAQVGFVKREWQVADSLKKEIFTCKLPDTDVPAFLKEKQYIPFDDPNRGFKKLLKDLKGFEDKLRIKEYSKNASALPEFDFIPIPAGKFRFSIFKKTVRVEAFEIADFPVTLDQFPSLGNNEVSRDGDSPVTNVSWDQAVQYCKWLSQATGSLIKLPSEMQWEYAAKAGQELEYATKDGKITKCNYNNHEQKTIHKGDRPNPFEVYDMSGNVWEWCEDLDPILKDYRIVRGGSWIDPPENCRTTSRHSFHRSHTNLYTSFRVIRVPK